MSKIILTLLCSCMIAIAAHASWYNPFSWHLPWWEPDQSQYVTLDEVKTKTAEADKRHKEEVDALEKQFGGFKDMASKGAAYVAVGKEANQSNPPGAPRTTTDALLDQGLKKIPVAPDPEEYQKAVQLKIAGLEGKLDEFRSLLKQSDESTATARLALAKYEKDVEHANEAAEAARKDRDQKISDANAFANAQIEKIKTTTAADIAKADAAAEQARKDQKAAEDGAAQRQLRIGLLCGAGVCGTLALIVAAIAYFTSSIVMARFAAICGGGGLLFGSLAIAVGSVIFTQVSIGVGVLGLIGTVVYIIHIITSSKAVKTEKVTTDAHAKAFVESVPAIANLVSDPNAATQLGLALGNSSKQALAKLLTDNGYSVPEQLVSQVPAIKTPQPPVK